MTIQSVEQVLDGAIALLMYGSGTWLSYSLVIFVVTRSKASVSPVVEETVIEEAVLEEIMFEGSISIEVTPEAIADISPLPLLPQALAASPIPSELPPMVCEPVNWKQWKVAELRESSITQVCGVRTSPIGSSRKLKKGDLIAQYEQNLRRMTYEPSEVVSQNEKIA